MQRLAFRKIFNQFSHISYLLISFTTKFELQKSNYFCRFNINASEKKIILSLSRKELRSLPVSHYTFWLFSFQMDLLISQNPYKFFVCDMESWYKNISGICNITFTFQNLQKKLKKFKWILKKSMNSFAMKKIGHLIIYWTIIFLQNICF